MSNETLCWQCSKSYDIKAAKCPHCGAANGNHDLEKSQGAALPERSPTEKEEAEVLALAEDYGQWMWDAGYMDNPTGETLVDEAAAKREEIEKALNSLLCSAYADGRRDEREALMNPTEAMIEAGKDERMECLKLPQSPPISVGEALTRIYQAMLGAAK